MVTAGKACRVAHGGVSAYLSVEGQILPHTPAGLRELHFQSSTDSAPMLGTDGCWLLWIKC